MLGFHCVFRLKDSRAIAPDVAARRRLARTLYQVGRRARLFVFRCSVDHLHTGLDADRETAGAFAQAAGSALKQALGHEVGFAPAHMEPIADQRHLRRVFDYVLRNAEKHRVPDDDPFHDASSLPELLGLRANGADVIPRVRKLLPGTRREQLLDVLGVPELQPACVAEWLADAAAGALGLPDLAGRSPEVVRARAAAVQAASGVLETPAVADALGVTTRTVRNLQGIEAPAGLVRAVSLRMGLRAALGSRANVRTAPFTM